MEKVIKIPIGSPHTISSFLRMPEPAEFTDNTLLDNYGDPYKVASVCTNVQATESLVEFIKKKMSAEYFELDRIEDGKCHKYAKYRHMRPHKDRQVSDDHIFTLVITQQNGTTGGSRFYVNNEYIECNTICLFHPHVEHEVKMVIDDERISYIFKVFGKMNWYKYFLSQTNCEKLCYPNFIENIIDHMYVFNKLSIDQMLYNRACLKPIMLYSDRYHGVVLSICDLLGVEPPVIGVYDGITWPSTHMDAFIPKNIYHVVFQDDTEQDFVGVSEIRGNIKSIAVKKLSRAEQVHHYLTEIKTDIDEKYMEYLKNLNIENVLEKIKSHTFNPDTMYYVTLAHTYESGVPYDGLHDIDKKIYDYIAPHQSNGCLEIKNVIVTSEKNVINVFKPSPYQDVSSLEFVDEGAYHADMDATCSCLVVMITGR